MADLNTLAQGLLEPRVSPVKENPHVLRGDVYLDCKTNFFKKNFPKGIDKSNIRC